MVANIKAIETILKVSLLSADRGLAEASASKGDHQ
jgi:hypothetical protein